MFQVFRRSRARRWQAMIKGWSLPWRRPANSLPLMLKMMMKRRKRWVFWIFFGFSFTVDCFFSWLSLSQSKVGVLEKLKEPALDVPSAGPERKRSPSASPDRKSPEENLSPAGLSLNQHRLLTDWINIQINKKFPTLWIYNDIKNIWQKLWSWKVLELFCRKSVWILRVIPASVDFFVSSLAAQLLELLDSRKKQFMKAALQAKQKDDMEQAKVFLRTAKSLDPMIEAARSGKTVDINTVSRKTCPIPAFCETSQTLGSFHT